MSNLYKNFTYKNILLLFVILFAFNIKLSAQITISTSNSGISGQVCHENCEGTLTDGDRGDYCSDVDWNGYKNGDVIFCPQNVVPEGEAWDSDNFAGCSVPPWDCDTYSNAAGYTLKPGSTSSGTLSHSWQLPPAASTCGGTFTYSVSGSGTWPNNVTSSTGVNQIANNSCTNSITSNNTTTSGANMIPGVGWLTLDCQNDAWYTYQLTTANLSYIAFTGDKLAGSLTAATDIPEVRFNTTASCTGSCALTDAGITGDFSVSVPAVGYYFVRIKETLVGNIERARIIHNRGGTLPAGDILCNAIDLGTLDPGDVFNASGNNSSFTREQGCSLNEPGGQDNTVWYKFTIGPTLGPIVSVDVDASGACTPWMKTYRQVSTPSCPFSFTSNGFTAITEVMDGGIDGYEEMSCNTFSAGQVYYVQVDITGLCTTGSFTLEVKMPNSTKAPDECVNAINIGGGTLNVGATLGNKNTISYSNICATASPQTDPWSLGGVDNDVWLKFTTAAGAGRDVTIDATNDPLNLGDQMDIQLALYEGCPNTGPLIDNDYDPGLLAETMEVTCLKPSTTYYVRVDGDVFGVLLGNGTKGHFGIEVKENGPYPSNDLICGAKALAPTTPYTYNSVSYAAEDNTKGTYCFEPDPNWAGELFKDNDHAIWYYFGQVPGRTIVVDANDIGSDDINLQMALYSSPTAKGSCVTPGALPVLTEVQKDNNVISNNEDAYFTCLDPAKYYWLMVDGSGGVTGLLSALEEGDFSIKAWFPEEGEITGCAAEYLGAVPDAGSLYVKNLSNMCGASSIANFPEPSTFGFDKAVIYTFTTPPSVGFTDASVKIEAFTNPYYDEVTYAGPGAGAGGNMDMLENAFNSGDDIDLQLALYSDGACGSSHFVKGSNYDPTVGSGVDITGASGSDESLIVNCLLPSTVYYLVVDGGALNTSGYYDIKISNYNKHTTNDFLCNAIDITATNSAPWTNCNSSTVVQLNGQNNYCATTNNDIPGSLGIRPPGWSEMNAPVWYKFKAPKSGKLKIEAINSISDLIPPYDEPEISAQLAVFFLPGGYNGTCTNLSTEKDRLIHIQSDYDGLFHDEEMTVECLMADSIYYLLVDGSSATLCPGCTRGEFYLKLTADPRDRAAPNDLICDAINLGTPAVWTNPTAYDTRVSPASSSGTYTSPSTGYPSATGLHNGVRSNAGSCMRVENNYCAGIDNEPAVNGGNFLTDFSPDGTVWYKFTAPTTGEVKINTISDPDSRGDLIYTQIGVFETSDNTCTGTMIGIAADGIPTNLNGDNELTVKCLDPGKTYFLMVDGAGVNKRGYFELQIQAVPATLTGPANDDICNATSVTYPASIGATTTLTNQTNRCATIQNVYSEPTTFTKDADVWYKFTTPNTAAPHAVEVTVTSGLPWPFGDAMDPQIALYKGSCPSSFTLVDDGYSALGLPFYETFDFHCLEQNTTYYLMVDGSGLNEQGNFKLDIKRISPHPLAGNDNICAVVSGPTGSLGTLGAASGNKVGNTTTNWHNFCSDVEVGEPALMTDGNYTLDQTVWFKFRTPNTANNIDVEIRALSDPNNVGDEIDLQMLLVQGNPGCSPTSFTSLTPIESVDPLLTFNATMNVCLPPNTDFYINVDGSGLNKQGYFTVEVENKGLTSAPGNDNICSAKTLPSGGVITGAYTGYLNDNNNCATLQSFEKQQAPGSIQRSVWYKFVAPTSADVSITVKGNSWVPFTTNYFLPDITIWELNDGTYASPATGISGCSNPNATQWNKLEFNDYQGIPNSLASGLYPTVVLTPLCLKPNYTYYVQVDGSAGVGLDGYFDITIKNNQASYTGPTNNECGASSAITLPVSSASCQFSSGTWQTKNYGDPTWSNPSLMGSSISTCTANCGDIWYKFQMPAACGNNTKSFVKIEGNDELGVAGITNSNLAIAAYNAGASGSCATSNYLKCSTGGSGADPDFSITGNPSDWIYLQVWDQNGDDFGKNFQICVSEQKSADDCSDATDMTLDVPYCWSVESHGGETPNAAIPGSGLNTCFGSGNPEHSSYFKFTTDATADFCDDYYVYINTAALAKALPAGANHACLTGINSSVSLNYSLWQLKTGGTACTPGVANVSQEDCITFNDCGGGSFGSNVIGPHGNGGLVNDSIWYNLATGQALLPNTTYYIVLDYNIDNPLYASRVVLDGIIQVGRRCKGRTWEYTTASTISTNKYCTSRDGWRHYYDDKGTVATGDDKYVFSLFPNGNTFEGTATITLDPTFHRFEDFPNHYAEYVMRRRWDFQVSTGSVVNPVKVRFYYQNSEKQEIITAAQSFAVMYPSNYEDFEWFKSANGHVFSPYTDVNPKVISVGPNGFSETGCLSYWDATGAYVGPPGVTRCITKVITDWDDNNTYHEWCNGIHFCEYNGLTGFSGGTGGTGDSPYDVSPLPVELISFTGYNNGAVNVLDWSTASEINTLKFEVERRTLTSTGFTYIGEKPAAGNSSTILNYTINDESPTIGDNYYRLKMIDIDGTYEYSQTIVIKNNDNSILNDVISNIYPNPTNQTLYIDYQSSTNSNIKLSVYDALGQEMMINNLTTVKGNQQFKLNVNSLANGVYIIHIQDQKSGKILQTKFVKE